MGQKMALGIDYDHFNIRMALLSRVKKGKSETYRIEQLEQLSGNFVKDDHLVAGLKELKAKLLKHKHGYSIASCIGGKQVYCTKLAFKKLPDEEMRKALKFEIRKELPFESASATLEFQVLKDKQVRTDDKVNVMATAATNTLINRQMRLLAKAGLKQDVMEVLPLVATNAFWECNKKGKVDPANIILHIGTDISTLIIDGDLLPYYNRLIYFSAEELFADVEDPTITGNERERRIQSLADEIIRSLSYYEDNYENISFSTINILGGYCSEEILAELEKITGLKVVVNNLVKNTDESRDVKEGLFEIATTLALRAFE
jgi:Tfp pilus assembly PilM family ATPase